MKPFFFFLNYEQVMRWHNNSLHALPDTFWKFVILRLSLIEKNKIWWKKWDLDNGRFKINNQCHQGYDPLEQFTKWYCRWYHLISSLKTKCFAQAKVTSYRNHCMPVSQKIKKQPRQ